MGGVISSGELLDAQRVSACPRRVGVGEVVRIGERIDRSGPPTGQRTRDGVVDADEPTGRVGQDVPQVGLRRHHRMVERFHEVRRQSPGNGQHRRRHPRHHAGIHPADGQFRAPLSGQAGIGAQQVAVGRGLRAINVVRAGRHAVGVGDRDEVVEDVGDRDRVDRVRRPRRKRNEQEPVADVTQHLERRRPRADDHRSTQPHYVGTAVEAQRIGDLGTAGQVFGQVVLVGDEPAKVHDPPNAGFLCRVRHIGGGTIVGVTKVRLADAVHQVKHHIDGTGLAEGVLRRPFVVCVQCDAGDVVMPAEIDQSVGSSGGGDDVVAGIEQGGDEPRTDIAGGAGHQGAHGIHRTAVPDLPRTKTPQRWQRSSRRRTSSIR